MISFTGFDVYDRVDNVIHRMPSCSSPHSDPYKNVFGGILTEPLIRYRYFPETRVRHRMYIAENVQDITSIYRFIRSGMPPTSTIEHWVKCQFQCLLTGKTFWFNSFVSFDVQYTVEQFHNLFCKEDDDNVISGEPEENNVFTMLSFTIVYREAV